MMPQKTAYNVHQYRTQSSLRDRNASGSTSEVIGPAEWKYRSNQSFHARRTSAVGNQRRNLFRSQVISHGRMRTLIFVASQRKKNYWIFTQNSTCLYGG